MFESHVVTSVDRTSLDFRCFRCWGLRLHSGWEPALAAGGRLNQPRTGALQQQPCYGIPVLNESCYSLQVNFVGNDAAGGHGTGLLN